MWPTLEYASDVWSPQWNKNIIALATTYIKAKSMAITIDIATVAVNFFSRYQSTSRDA